MKKKLTKVLSVLLCVLMLLSSAPLDGIAQLTGDKLMSLEASAISKTYCATASAQWAKDHVWDYNSILLGKGYYAKGGDCANFVSQCLYMGGLDMDRLWNNSGYYCHWGDYYKKDYEGSFIRVDQLYRYLKHLGAQVIQNPSPSQCSVGDVLIYCDSTPSDFTHSAIITDVDNGKVTICYHSVDGSDWAVKTTDWRIRFTGAHTYLLKLNGSTCVNSNPRDFDVYTAGNDSNLYAGTSTSSGCYNTFLAGEYAHVYRTAWANGYKWGYTFRYGSWGWIKLSDFNYQRHVKSSPVDHDFGNWYTDRVANCIQDGIEKRVCKRCGYAQTKTIKGGHSVTVATCTSPSYCTICGTELAPALGHSRTGEYVVTLQPTCLEEGTKILRCNRVNNGKLCNELLDTKAIPALGHDMIPGATAPNCTSDGLKTYVCSRCSYSYVDYIDSDDTWSDWTTDKLDLPADKIQSKVQYRYSTKSTETRTNTTGTAPAVSGYTLDSTTWVWNDYGPWSGWKVGTMSANEYREVETKSEHTGYNMVSNCYRKAGNTYRYYTNFWLGDSSAEGQAARLAKGYTAEYFQWERTKTVSISEFNSATRVSPGQSSPRESYWGYNDINETGYWMSYEGEPDKFAIYFVRSKAYTDYYTYRERTKQYTYNYIKWSEWSPWQDTAVTSNDTRNVETRTVYKYDIKALGHDPAVSDTKNYYVNDTQLEYSTSGYGACYWNGTYCQRKGCGAHLDTTDTNHSFPVFDKNNIDTSVWEVVDETSDNLIIYKAYCAQGCGCYVIQSAEAHRYNVTTVAPSCLEQGYDLHTCINHSNCYYKDNYTDALGHDFANGETVYVAPTCTTAGSITTFCSRHGQGREEICDGKIVEVIAPLGHDLQKADAVMETCLTDGNTEYYYCNRNNCGKFFSDSSAKNEIEEDSWIIKAAGKHVDSADGKWITIREAKCGVSKLEECYCTRVLSDGSVCDALIDERETLSSEHNVRVVNSQNAVYDEKTGEWKGTTCAEDCWIEYACVNTWNGEPCDMPHYTKYLTVDHTPETNRTEPSCVHPGHFTTDCTVCGKVLTEGVIEAEYTSHNYKVVETIKSECAAGTDLIHYVCTRCGETECGSCEENDTPHHYWTGDPSVHDIILDNENSYPAKCLTEGLEVYKCKNCDYTESIVLPALGHDWDGGIETPATCTDDGYKTHTCQRTGCGAQYDEFTETAPGHDYSGTYVVEKKANCTEDGYKTLHCVRVNNGKVCGHLLDTKKIPARNHSMGERYEYLVSGTQTCYRNDCLNTENSEYESCSFYTTSSHAYGKWVYDGEETKTHTKVCANYNNHIETENCTFKSNVTRKADCVNDGERLYTCVVCGGTYTTVIEARNHSFGEWYTVTEAKCEKAGLERRDCVHTDSTDEFNPCDKYETRVINAKGHTEGKPVQENYVAPKCEIKGGYDTVVYCSDCGKELSRVHTDINPLDHDWDDGVKDPDSDCTKEGSMLYTCKRDSSHTKRVAISAKGHVAGQMKVTTKASCIADGLKEQKCTVCGAVLATEVIKARAHKMTDWHVTKEATCTEKGQEQRECLNTNETELYTACDLVETRETAINPDNHNLTHHDAKAPTCEEDGYKAYDTCSRCDYTTYEVVKAHGHDYNKIDSKCVAPNCENDGYDYYECSYDASHNYTVTVKANGHTPGQMKVTTKASCTADGLKEQKCTVCSKVLATEVIKARIHNMTEWHVTKEATCTEKGQEQRECLNTNETELYTACDLVETRETAVNPDNHNLVHHDAKAPTCEEDGYKAYDTCSKCDYTTYEVVKATGHNYAKVYAKSLAPTYDADGYDYYECKNDASHNYKVPVDKLISYVATFVIENENGTQTIVDEVRFTPGTTFINEPDLAPYDKDNYTVDWEEYTLKDEDITIKAIYTPIDPDDVSEIETDKDVEYNNGVASITLSAGAPSRTIRIDSVKQKPVDIVLVLDQSGSMDYDLNGNSTSDISKKKIGILKKCATSFVNSVAANSPDSRVAVVGFGSGGSGYNGSKVVDMDYAGTMLLATNNRKETISYPNITTADYADSLMPVVKSNITNPDVIDAIKNLSPNGATRADLGLEMAMKIFASYPKLPDRERLVVFLTDGVPTNYGETEIAINSVVPTAIEYAKDIKACGSKIYTIGVVNGADPNAALGTTANGISYVNKKLKFDFNRFLNIISSNYPSAVAMDDYGNKANNGYYMAVSDASNLDKIFSTILVSSVMKKLTFKKATLVDTLTSDFTLTLEQEEAMRKNLKDQYNISDGDISVDRKADGSTTIRINNVPAVKTEKDGKDYYLAQVTFDCSLNKVQAGEYSSNQNPAEVEIGGEKVKDFPTPEKIKIESERCIAIFKMNGEVYAIYEGNAGDDIAVPVSELAKWNVDEEYSFENNPAIFEAEEINDDEYAVTWVVGDSTTTEFYRFGEKINIPEVINNGDLEFKGFSPAVPAVMPARNLIFTAEYTQKHVHEFVQTAVEGNCDNGFVTLVKKCSCGTEKRENKAVTGGHALKAVINDYTSNTVNELIYCENCYYSAEHVLTFSASTKKTSTAVELNLLKSGTKIQPDANGVKIMIPWTGTQAVRVKRVNENGVAKTYDAKFENGYLVFIADHFSMYVIEELDENGNEIESLTYAQAVCLINGHTYTLSVTAPTCVGEGYTTYSCSNCGETYKDNYIAATGHTASSWITDVPNTCEVDGSAHKECKVCSEVLSTKVIEKTGHKKGNDGKCLNCGADLRTENEKNCTHICHRTGKFYKIIWKIILVFCKLFKINKVCACGKIHY